jgi:hypothetical protein
LTTVDSARTRNLIVATGNKENFADLTIFSVLSGDDQPMGMPAKVAAAAI